MRFLQKLFCIFLQIGFPKMSLLQKSVFTSVKSRQPIMLKKKMLQKLSVERKKTSCTCHNYGLSWQCLQIKRNSPKQGDLMVEMPSLAAFVGPPKWQRYCHIELVHRAIDSGTLPVCLAGVEGMGNNRPKTGEDDHTTIKLKTRGEKQLIILIFSGFKTLKTRARCIWPEQPCQC